PAESATELVIERPGERIVCRKEQGQWRILAPILADADDMTVQRILTDFAESKVVRTVTAHPGALALYGLPRGAATGGASQGATPGGAARGGRAPPPIQVTVTAGKQQQTVEIGKPNPTGSFVFAQRSTAPDAPVLLVEQRIRDAAEKKLYDLRDKTVLDFSPDDVNGITYAHGATTIRMVRQAGTSEDPQPGWKLAQPLRVRADRGAVERSLNLVSSLRAEQFASEKPQHLERFGLDRPSGSARFDLKGGHTERLLLGRKTTEGA